MVRKTLDEVTGALHQVESLDASGRSAVLDTVTGQVFRFFLLILGVALLRGALMFLMRQTIIVMSRHIEYDLKNEVFDHYQRLSLSFYRRNNTGDLMNRISEDVSRVRMYVGPAVMYAINLIVMFVLVIISMWHVNHTLTLYVVAPPAAFAEHLLRQRHHEPPQRRGPDTTEQAEYVRAGSVQWNSGTQIIRTGKIIRRDLS